MPLPTPTPLLPLSDIANETEGQEFLEFIRNTLIAENLERREDVSPEVWLGMVEALSDTFILPFLSVCTSPWSAIAGHIRIISGALDLIHKLHDRVPSLYCGNNQVPQNLFARFISISIVLSTQSETDSSDGELPTPATLTTRITEGAVGILRCLGGASSRGKEPSWLLLRAILSECLDTLDDLSTSSRSVSCPIALQFFESPRVQQNFGPADLVLVDESQVAAAVSVVFCTIARTLHPELVSSWYITDQIRRLAEAAYQSFEYLSSAKSPIAPSLRLTYIAMVAHSSISLPPALIPERFRICVVRYLLKERLRHDSMEGFEVADDSLLQVFDLLVRFNSSLSSEIVHCLLQIIRMRRWDETSESYLISVPLAFLQRCVPRLDLQTLFSPDCSIELKVEFIASGVETYLSQHYLQVAEAEQSIAWRSSALDIVKQMILPDELSWMEEDQATPDEDFIARLAIEVNTRCSRDQLSMPTSNHIAIAEGLIKLQRVLKDVPLDSYYRVIEPRAFVCLLAVDQAGDMSSVARTPLLDALLQWLRSVNSLQVEDAQQLSSLLCLDASNNDRTVRILAGRALNEILAHMVKHGNRAYINIVFDFFAQLFQTSKKPIKETVLVTVGLFGRTDNLVIRGSAFRFLLIRLNHNNPIIQGISYSQLSSMASHLGKSPMSAFLPLLREAAPFLITRMFSHPIMFNETLRLFSLSRAYFMKMCLPRILPAIYRKADRGVLDIVASDLNVEASTLFLLQSHRILAEIFLLTNPIDTNLALTFIVDHLTEEAGGKPIGVETVVKSCVVPLLAELVLTSGDGSDESSKAVEVALRKVEGVMGLKTGKSSRTSQNSTLEAFLQRYMLGIIAHFSGSLQETNSERSNGDRSRTLRSLGFLIDKIGAAINTAAPQIMAIFQSTVVAPELALPTVEVWRKFLMALPTMDVAVHFNPTCASLVSVWPQLPIAARKLAEDIVEYMLPLMDESTIDRLGLVDVSDIPELRKAQHNIQSRRIGWTRGKQVEDIVRRCANDNTTVAIQSLRELKSILLSEANGLFQGMLSTDMYDPLVGKIVLTLLEASSRESDAVEIFRSLAFECIGILGAVDPDRCELGYTDDAFVVLSNLSDEEEAASFALHLISKLLIGLFSSSSDIQYQTRLAYSIQELLKFCGITSEVLVNNRVSTKVKKRWSQLSEDVLGQVSPLLNSRYKVNAKLIPPWTGPIYRDQPTYREWIQLWARYLIEDVSGKSALAIFGVFQGAIGYKDATIALHLLPHLVLNILISGTEESVGRFHSEIMTVLEDQTAPDSSSNKDKRLLSAQAIFAVLDHLSKWVRIMRREISNKKSEGKRNTRSEEAQLSRVDSILASIDHSMMAKAAFQCKAYARSLMNYEQQALALKSQRARSKECNECYERLHEIYANLDEPDGMEGVSTLILSPSLEHQIRLHESTGNWTSAQSCWELKLQQSPDDLNYHLGLLRCLRNLGHHDTLQNHVVGILTRHPKWEPAVIGFKVESAWITGAWDDVKRTVDTAQVDSAPIITAKILLAMRSGDEDLVSRNLGAARSLLGIPIVASGKNGYRQTYDAALNLHCIHELELIGKTLADVSHNSLTPTQGKERLAKLSNTLSNRLALTVPNFWVRQSLMSLRRTAFSLIPTNDPALTEEIGSSWLASAKIARKVGQWQTAYSAVLQAQQHRAAYAFVESSKLLRATGEPSRSLQELENAMRFLGWLNQDDADKRKNRAIDVDEDPSNAKTKAKVQLLLARWMDSSGRYDTGEVLEVFKKAHMLYPEWESAPYHVGKYQDDRFKELSSGEQFTRGMRFHLNTVRYFTKAVQQGSKYVYQAIPRVLTIWLDAGEDPQHRQHKEFSALNEIVHEAISTIPAYKWFTAFPQIVSRVGHDNPIVYLYLEKLISTIVRQYPKQALWFFTSVIKSTKTERQQRGKTILDQLRNEPKGSKSKLKRLINNSVSMTNELLALCDYSVNEGTKSLTISGQFPKLQRLTTSADRESELIIPLQESLTVTLPTTSNMDSHYEPFPLDAPKFNRFEDTIEIMHSLAKPRKITVRGSDGQIYMFLGKPKDDLRKDARLMDFNSVINKLLKANSESRRRQLHIRTYGVITLNEECGFIQWVPNTIPIRPVLNHLYNAKKIPPWGGQLQDIFRRIKARKRDSEAGELFEKEVLIQFPPILHEWFIETFPEPSAWLASRLCFARTAAVMSMVGFILGLGDRHLENILLDVNTGAAIHVDFNCLFEKGKTLETPERVPFRLTQNMVDGFGIAGVEGIFRIACQVSLNLLRSNKDSLMSILDAFIHDPLMEWEDLKRKLDREARITVRGGQQKLPSNHANHVKKSADLRSLAKKSLTPIEKKLSGIYTPGSGAAERKPEKESSVGNLVQTLILEATDSNNLGAMYPGWAPWH